MELNRLKIMVTGGAGFIGSHLVDRLIEMGNHVIVYDNFDDYYTFQSRTSKKYIGVESHFFRN